LGKYKELEKVLIADLSTTPVNYYPVIEKKKVYEALI